MVFYAYNPLAGGILSGKHQFKQMEEGNVAKGRFAGTKNYYVSRYWKKEYFEAVDLV